MSARYSRPLRTRWQALLALVFLVAACHGPSDPLDKPTPQPDKDKPAEPRSIIGPY